MFTIQIDMHDPNSEKILGDIAVIQGYQGVIRDKSTGILFRIMRLGNSGFYLNDGDVDISCGFLANAYRQFFDFTDRGTHRILVEKVNKTIKGLKLSEDELKEVIQTGLLKMLAKKNPDLLETEGFSLVLKMEYFDQSFKKSIGEIPDEITQLLETGLFDGEEKQALEILKKVYNSRMEQEKATEGKTGLQKILDLYNKGEITSHDVLLAASIILGKQTDMVQAIQHIVSDNRGGPINGMEL